MSGANSAAMESAVAPDALTGSASIGTPQTREARTTHPELPEAAIRERAYEIYLSRGASDGDPVTDWLSAERQLLDRG